jgi:hypothetical protein
VPHAEGEEGVLYPLLDKVMGAAWATATMVADHREIHHHVDAFARLVDAIAQGPPQRGQLEALREHLSRYGPSSTSTSTKKSGSSTPCSTNG